MKRWLLDNPIMEVWRDASSPLEYLVAFWITGLGLLAVSMWLVLVIRFIMNPSMFDGVTWGLIDYI